MVELNDRPDTGDEVNLVTIGQLEGGMHHSGFQVSNLLESKQMWTEGVAHRATKWAQLPSSSGKLGTRELQLAVWASTVHGGSGRESDT